MTTPRDTWFTPRRTNNGATCVEVMVTADTVFVRNDVRPLDGTAAFTYDEWRVFVASVRDGDYDV